jgi:hypothetical protein
MQRFRRCTVVRLIYLFIVLIMLCCVPAFSQQLALADPTVGGLEPNFAIRSTKAVSISESPNYRFWDRENRILFIAVAGLSTADFAATYFNVNNGGKEFNPVTRLLSRSTAGLGFNFAGETVAVIGLSYIFHKTGHHKLERIASIADIGTSAAAISYDRTH